MGFGLWLLVFLSLVFVGLLWVFGYIWLGFVLSYVLGYGGGCVVVVNWWPLVHLGSCVLY